MSASQELLLPVQKTIRERTSFPEVGTPSVIVGTDLEGPHVLGDTVALVMSAKVRPQNSSTGSPDYGSLLYLYTYDWFTDATLSRRRTRSNMFPNGLPPLSAQEGTDTLFTLAPLLTTDITDTYIEQVALGYKRTPGSTELIDYLKSEGGLVVGITTAPEKPYLPVAKEIGLHGLVGTPYPLDAMREILIESGRYEQEIEIIRSYLKDCFAYIDKLHVTSDPWDKGSIEEELIRRIRRFHDEELGISYDSQLRKSRDASPTVIGRMIEELQVVGDRAKAAVALGLFRNNPNPNVLTVTIGDGTNDKELLQKGKLSIALNGGPVDYARVGVITDDVSTLIPLIEIAKAHPEIGTEQLVQQSQETVGTRAIIHVGGTDVPYEIRREHKKMKLHLRGLDGTLLP